MFSLLKKSREEFLDRYHATLWADLFSATTWSIKHSAEPLTKQHCKGKVLDAGAGRGTWQSITSQVTSDYHSIDCSSRGKFQPTIIGDIQDMPDVPCDNYDTIICHQVFEHLPRPWLAVAEFYRVLRPSGKVIVSVPHLSRYHELPHDYVRFTEFGLRSIFTENGFSELKMCTYGGLLSFLHHQTSFIFPGLLIGIPIIQQLALLINGVISILLTQVENLTGPLRLPIGCIAVFQKPPLQRNS